MQIAQMVAEGLTNREIGERLFLSHRTIGSHLYRILPKLEIRSRSELAAAFGHLPALKSIAGVAAMCVCRRPGTRSC